MATILDKLIEELETKLKYSKIITSVSKQIAKAIKDVNLSELEKQIAKRGRVMKAIDDLDKSINNIANGVAPQSRLKLISLLNGKSFDPNSKISKLTREITLEMRRSLTLEKQNQDALKKVMSSVKSSKTRKDSKSKTIRQRKTNRV